jgi:hypothetical protein
MRVEARQSVQAAQNEHGLFPFCYNHVSAFVRRNDNGSDRNEMNPSLFVIEIFRQEA